jgi:glycosyltransferase involved in cell wall biosynthesis
MSRPRIAILSSLDTSSRRAFSGTPYYMAQALEKHCGSVVHLGPARSRIEAAGDIGNRFARRLFGREFAFDHSRALAREYARIFAKRLREEGPFDLIFAPAASTQIALLETDIPIIYASDATFQLMRDYHQDFTGISDAYAAIGNDIERRAIHRAGAVTYPSQWAARSAVRDYGASPERVKMVPWGANMDCIPEADSLWPAKDLSRCSLLFLGVNWERKGGPIAFAATDLLRRRGVDANLTVCGTTPPDGFSAPWLHVIPMLNKQNPAEERELSRLLLKANFLVLPTRNDCYGIVFCEASAHGTPSIATATGGVGGAVAEGRSGFLLPLEAGPDACAEMIHDLWSDKDRYRQLVTSSREHYETTVNWDRWGVAMREIIGRVAR